MREKMQLPMRVNMTLPMEAESLGTMNLRIQIERA